MPARSRIEIVIAVGFVVCREAAEPCARIVGLLARVIGQNGVGAIDVLEPLFGQFPLGFRGLGQSIRMPLLGKAPVRGAYSCRISVRADSQRLIVVLRHPRNVCLVGQSGSVAQARNIA